MSSQMGISTGAVGLAAFLVLQGGVLSTGGEVLAGLVLAVLAGVFFARSPRFDALETVLLTFLGWAAVTAILRSPDFLASKERLAIWTASILILVVVRRDEQSLNGPTEILLVATTLPVAGSILWNAMIHDSPFSGGVFINPNMAAAVLLTVVPMVAAFRGPLPRYGGGAFLALAIALTGSRAGLAALVVVTILLLEGKVRWIAGSLAAAAAVAVSWWRLATHPDALAWYRLRIWGAILKLFIRHPVTGVGPGGLSDASDAVTLVTHIGCSLHPRHIGAAESCFLGVLVGTGIVGTLLVLAAAWLALRLAHRHLPPDRRRIALATLGGAAVFMVFHDFLGEPGVLWWWAAAAALFLPRGNVTVHAPASRPTRILTGFVAAGVMAWLAVQPPLARWIVQPKTPSRLAALRMLRLEPWNADPARDLVQQALSGRGRPWTWETAGEALFWSDHVAGVRPGDASAQALLGNVNARIVRDLGIYPSAVSAARRGFGRACELAPHLPWYWADWATFERQMGELPRARDLASHAVTEEPNFVRGWLLLARIDLDLGQVDRAWRDLARARKARDCFGTRPLEPYEQDLARAPEWQWHQLEEALP